MMKVWEVAERERRAHRRETFEGVRDRTAHIASLSQDIAK
jgi:hypothetical protein